MLANASPRKPYVAIDVRSSKAFSFEVVNRSQRIGRSSRLTMSAHVVRANAELYTLIP